MVEIKDKELCCGCTACAEACPKSCITMHEDEEGFLYPIANPKDCISCGLCEKVCPILNREKKGKRPITVWAAYTLDEDIRKNSSSGGAFYSIASYVIRQGGVVFGTKYNNHWGAEFSYAETIEGLKALMVSKYVQSEVGTAYKDCEAFLKKNRNVLFAGTSCQISGLKHYLRHSYDNLLTIEIICHGVPSPRVWQMYLDEISGEKGADIKERKQIEQISFRRKDPSWDKFNMYISFTDKENETINTYHLENTYMKAFVHNLILRPTCYHCKFREGRAGADITIADYWGVVKFHPHFNDDKGTSLIMVGTNKGLEIINQLSLYKEKSSYKKAVYCNPAIAHSHTKHKKREYFFSNYMKEDSLSFFINDCLETSKCDRYKTSVRSFLNRVVKKLVFYFGK